MTSLRRAVLDPCRERAGRAYISGPSIDDAVALSRRLGDAGFAVTVGHWNRGDEEPAEVAELWCAAVRALRDVDIDWYLSVKAPAVAFDPELLRAVAAEVRTPGARVHLDAMQPESADRTWELLEAAVVDSGGVGCTLPGLWRRSPDDADRAAASGLAVRVVKGQWTDPLHPGRDANAGFLAVVDRLVARNVRVGVATHDAPLAAEALRRLRRGGTPCELELLVGMPVRAPLAVARAAGVPVRFYVPFGHPHLGYGLPRSWRRPRGVWWAVRDVVGDGRRREWWTRSVVRAGARASAARAHPPHAVDRAHEDGLGVVGPGRTTGRPR